MTEKVKKLTRKQQGDLLSHAVRYRNLVLINPGGEFSEEQFDSQFLWEKGAELFASATDIIIRLADNRVLVVGLKIVAFVTFFIPFDKAVDDLLQK